MVACYSAPIRAARIRKAGATAAMARSMISKHGGDTWRMRDSSNSSTITGPPACRASNSLGSPACGASRPLEVPGALANSTAKPRTSFYQIAYSHAQHLASVRWRSMLRATRCMGEGQSLPLASPPSATWRHSPVSQPGNLDVGSRERTGPPHSAAAIALRVTNSPSATSASAIPRDLKTVISPRGRSWT
jgi:hypothetical protein